MQKPLAKQRLLSKTYDSPSTTLKITHTQKKKVRACLQIKDYWAVGEELRSAKPCPLILQRAATSRAKHCGTGDLQQGAGCLQTA